MPGNESDPVFAEVFGRNLARYRQASGVSQEDLGLMADLHRTAVGQLERGERTARSDTLFKLAACLGVDPCALLTGLHWMPGEYRQGQLIVQRTGSGDADDTSERGGAHG